MYNKFLPVIKKLNTEENLVQQNENKRKRSPNKER